MTDTEKQRSARTSEATASCAWQMDEDGVWWTDCGEGFIIDNLDSPAENGFRFCCYCGREMREVVSDD